MILKISALFFCVFAISSEKDLEFLIKVSPDRNLEANRLAFWDALSPKAGRDQIFQLVLSLVHGNDPVHRLAFQAHVRARLATRHLTEDERARLNHLLDLLEDFEVVSDEMPELRLPPTDEQEEEARRWFRGLFLNNKMR